MDPDVSSRKTASMLVFRPELFRSLQFKLGMYDRRFSGRQNPADGKYPLRHVRQVPDAMSHSAHDTSVSQFLVPRVGVVDM
jgi:hypothetical protein